MNPHQNNRSFNTNNRRNFTNTNSHQGANNSSTNQSFQGDGNENSSVDHQTNQPPEDATDAARPEYTGAYTMIPPNESRRSKLQRMAQQEEEDLQRWRETHRPGPVQLVTERLGGGDVSMTEARQRQFVASRQSKLQKQLRKEELDRNTRQAEEEENQRMKAIQREKAIKLELKTKQEEQQRSELHQHDHQMRREQFLQGIEMSSSAPMAVSSSAPTSSWGRGEEHKQAMRAEENTALQQRKEEQRRKSEILEEKQKQLEEKKKREVEIDRRRVNSAFLDRVEAGGSGQGVVEPPPGTQGCSDVWQTWEPQDSGSSPEPSPAPVHTDSAEEDDSDHEWAVMRLLSNFPIYERAFIEDIVIQCNGNYQQAYELLQ